MTTLRNILLLEINPGLYILREPPLVVLGLAYSFSFGASGGTEPYTWSLSGTLPTGLSWDASTATISGTTSEPGFFPIVVSLKDALRLPRSKACTLHVQALPLSLSGTPSDPVLADSYSFTYTTSGGVSPYTYAITAGALPTGITLDEDTGEISGTPTVGGVYSWTITVTDSLDTPAPLSSSVTVGYATLALSGTYAGATLSSPYSSDLTITGGQTPYLNPRASSGSVPAGLALTVVGDKLRLSGTPTTTGSVSFTAAVDSTDGQTATSSQTVAVVGDPHFANVVALVHFDGTDGTQTFTDVTGNTWTPSNGTPVLSTSTKKFGTASGHFAAGGGYISTLASSKWNFGTQDWCIEVQRKRASGGSDAYGRIFQTRNGDVAAGITLFHNTDVGQDRLYLGISANGSTSPIFDSDAADLSGSVFQHVALYRLGNTIYLALDGEIQNSWSYSGAIYFDTSPSSTDEICVGGTVGRAITAYLDELRVTIGNSRYGSSDFSAPTGPFLDS